jgi:hypothetical protein
MSFTKLDEANERLHRMQDNRERMDRYMFRAATPEEQAEMDAADEEIYAVMAEIAELEEDPNVAFSRFYPRNKE